MATNKTRKVKLWRRQNPGYHERTVMLKKCGKKCFLGTKKSFPICSKNTCTVNKNGVLAAYKRSRQFRKKGAKYVKISKTAKKMLDRMQ
jgi:hypothetical protein